MSWQSKPDKLLLKPERRLSRTRTSRSILEVFGDMPADETGASGNQDSHTGIRKGRTNTAIGTLQSWNAYREIHFLALLR
jgi:hypothetical protein